MTAMPCAAKANAALAAMVPRLATSGSGTRGRRCLPSKMVLPALVEMPSISPSMGMPTCRPTPVRKPTKTARERKSARNPNLKMRAGSSRSAVSSATLLTSTMYLALSVVALCERELEKIAAVALSAATTGWPE
jgi:hypothetical protein